MMMEGMVTYIPYAVVQLNKALDRKPTRYAHRTGKVRFENRLVISRCIINTVFPKGTSEPANTSWLK